MKFRFLILFFLFVDFIFSLEDQKIILPFEENIELNCNLGYFYIDSNEQGSGGGHAGFLIHDYVYHYQRIYDQFFVLDKTEIDKFIYNYSRILNRNLTFLCIDTLYVNQDLTTLKDKLELKHTKDNFYAFTYLYYQNLFNQLNQDRFFIPVVPYFLFSEEDFLSFIKSYNIDQDRLKRTFNYNITLYLLEIFYKYHLKNSLTINQNYFIKIYNNEENKLYDELIKNLKFYLKEWEEDEEWIKSQITEDTYLALLESKVYKEVLNHIIKYQQISVPFLLVKYEKGTIITIEINNKTIDLNKEIEDPIYNNIKRFLQYQIEEFYKAINNKEPLQTIQYHLKKISLLANQLLLLQNNENIFKLNIGILHTPQLYYSNTKLYELIKQKISNYKEINEALKQKLITLKHQYPIIFEYHLLFQNCITELFLLLYKEVDDPVLKNIVFNVYNRNKIIYNTLNGHFIPWKSYDAFKEELKNHKIPFQEYYIPSFRNEYLRVMKNNNQNTIKEMTTLTSEVYQYNTNDSFFIFFTEQNVYLRPVLGLFNMSFSLLKISYDILKLPYDIYNEQVYISKEFRGLFFSFTELGFVNVRKGTYLYNNFTDEYRKIFFQSPLIQIKKDN